MSRIKELDEDHCLVGTPPPTYNEPNDDFIDPPSLQPLPESELVCGLDGLTYHPDGRLYIQRNTTDNTTIWELCDFHLNVSSGCLFIGSHEQVSTFFAVGDVNVDDLTVNIIHPDGVRWYRFDIQATSDYNLTDTAGFTALAAAEYNLTDYPTSTNCTIPLPDPLPVPITPGLSCATNTIDTFLRYRPSDNYPVDNEEALTGIGIAEAQVYYFLDGDMNDVFDYNGTTFEPMPGEAQPVTCYHATVTGTTCDPFGTQAYNNEVCSDRVDTITNSHRDLRYNGQVVHPRLPNGTCFGYNGYDLSPPLLDYTGVCTADQPFSLGDDNFFTCRYNRVRQKSVVLAFGESPDLIDESMLDSLPLQTFDLHDTEIPCSFTVSEDFFCDANNHSWANYSGTMYPLYYSLNNTSPFEPVPCFNNSRQLPTLCREVELNYTDGRHVVVRLDGQHLTYTVDGVQQDLACDVFKPQESGISGSSTDMASVLEGYHTSYSSKPGQVPDVNGTYWKGKIKTYVTRVRASLNLFSIMEVGDPYAKDAFLCCVADFMRRLVRFLVSFFFEWAKFFRSIMALPAYFNDIEAFDFDLPTFRNAKDELRESLCRLSCAITHILPDIFNCTSLEGAMGCGTTSLCVTGLFCHVLDIPLLLAEVVVEILETVRSLIRDDETDINNNLNNSDCQQNNVGDCIAGIFVYIVTKACASNSSPRFHLIVFSRSSLPSPKWDEIWAPP